MAITITIDGVSCPVYTSEPSFNVSASGEVVTKTISVRGYFIGNAAAIASAQSTLEAALDGISNGSYIKIHDGGSTYDIINSAVSGYIPGTMYCRNRSFGPGPAQLVTNRQFEFSVSAQFFRANTSDIVSWNETVSIQIGGKKKNVFTVLGGELPARIQETVLLPTQVVQAGGAVGLGAYPLFPTYLYSESNLVYPVSQSKSSPTRVGESGTWTHWPITWNYEYIYTSSPGLFNPYKAPYS